MSKRLTKAQRLRRLTEESWTLTERKLYFEKLREKNLDENEILNRKIAKLHKDLHRLEFETKKLRGFV